MRILFAVLSSFYYQLDTNVTLEEGTSTQKLSESYFLMGIFVGALSCLLICIEGPIHCGQYHGWVYGLGLNKKVSLSMVLRASL